MTKPACYDRKPFAESYTAANGEEVPFTMSQECGSWKAPDDATPYPLLAGWNCEGCRWKPQDPVWASVPEDRKQVFTRMALRNMNRADPWGSIFGLPVLDAQTGQQVSEMAEMFERVKEDVARASGLKLRQLHTRSMVSFAYARGLRGVYGLPARDLFKRSLSKRTAMDLDVFFQSRERRW